MKPIRILKAVFLIKIIALLALLFAVILISLFVLLFPKNKIESIINMRAENILQRRIDIGSISYSFRGVKLSNVQILEPDSGNSYVSADSVEITFALLPIFKRELVLQDLYIEKLSLFVDYSDDTYNLEKMIRDIQLPSVTNFTATMPRFHLTDAAIEIRNTGTSLVPLRGSYRLDADIMLDDANTIRIESLSTVLPAGRGTLSGDLSVNTADEPFDITGDVELDTIDIRWVYYFRSMEEPADLPYRLINGKITDLHITPQYTEGTVIDTTGTLSNGVTINIESGYCRVPYNPKELILQNVRASANKSTFLLKELDVVFDNTAVLFDADLYDVNVQDVQAMIPPIESLPLEGNVSGNLSYRKKRFNGTLNLTNAGLTPYITDVTESVTLSDNLFSKEDITVSILGQEAHISIASLSHSFDSFAFNADFDSFIFDDEKQKTVQLPDSAVNISVKGIISADTARLGEIDLQDVYCAYEVHKGGITLPRFKTTFENGSVTGQAEITRLGTHPLVQTRLNISRVQIQRLSPYIPKIKNRFYGLVSGNADLSFTPGDTMIESMDGALNVKIENGKLLNTGIQNSLGIILQPLRYKLSDLEFREIFGNITIDDNGYDINSLMFNSPNIRLSVNGTITRQNIGNLDITLLFNNMFIQDIPNFAYPQFQQYRQGDWYIVPFEINNKNVVENPQAELVN